MARRATRKVTRIPAFSVLLALAAGAFVVLLVRSGSEPEGPSEIAWDAAECAQCRMHVGDPRFAAQLRGGEGELHVFDDPGCLFVFTTIAPVAPRAEYFHHVRESRWIPRDEVGFERVSHSPMGYGLGAVSAGSDDTLTYDEARRLVLEREGLLRDVVEVSAP